MNKLNMTPEINRRPSMFSSFSGFFGGWRTVIAVSTIALAFVAYGASFLIQPQFRSSALILVIPQRVPEEYVKSTVATRIEDRLQTISNQILSRTRLERIIQDFDLYTTERRAGWKLADIVNRMRDRIDVKVERGHAFRVTFADPDAAIVMKVTDRLADLFVEESLRDREVLAEGTQQLLEAQLQESRVAANLERRQIGEQFKLLDAARKPEAPFTPDRVFMTLVGAATGFAMGFVMVLSGWGRGSGRPQQVVAQQKGSIQMNEMTMTNGVTPTDQSPRAQRRVGWKSLIALTLFGAAVGFLMGRKAPEYYRADTLILVIPQRVPESYVKSAVTTRIEDRLQAISNQILSRTRLERIIQDFDLYSLERRNRIMLMEEVVDRMRDDIDVKVERGDAFRVAYIGRNPTTVMKVTDRLAGLFIEESLRDREVLAEGTSQFLEIHIQETSERLVEQHAAVRAARRKDDPEAVVLGLEEEVLQAWYKDLVVKREESRIATNLERRQIGEQFKLLDSARKPERPISPNRRVYSGYGALGGVGLGLAMIFGLPPKRVRNADNGQSQAS